MKRDSAAAHQVLNDLLDAFLGRFHAVFGSLQRHPLAVGPGAREADGHAAVLLGQLPQHLTPPAHEVAVVASVHYHVVLHHVILQRHFT